MDSDDWNGKGVPSPGQRVRVRSEKHDIDCCADVVGHHVGKVVVWMHSDMGYSAFHPEFIHPARTEEDQAVEEMVKDTFIRGRGPLLWGQEHIAKMLYRAGWRKQ